MPSSRWRRPPTLSPPAAGCSGCPPAVATNGATSDPPVGAFGGRRLADREDHRAQESSRGTYGAPRVHAELVLGEGLRVGRKRIARLMAAAGIQGIFTRRRKGCTRRNPADAPADDLVKRDFNATGQGQLWVSDVTEHPTHEGKVYLAVVLDAWSRRVVGWSIADHMRTELVVDALQMAIWRRRPAGQTIVHSDRGSQYTAWAFGRRPRAAGLLGSMGAVGDALDNAMAESFFGTLQRELLDRRQWASRKELAQAIFDYIEAFYNPRRHSSIGNLSPVEFEALHSYKQDAA
ncbi:MAG TPA: IS3 family transposase [Actinomycetota bacterium]|nr:IS3 family transposase [Actinomycetota bacterium]